MIAQPDNTKTDVAWARPSRPLPKGLSPERAWRWCVLATVVDYRRSLQKGRPISRPNLMRLFQRRWREAAGSSQIPLHAAAADGMIRRGKSAVAAACDASRTPSGF